MLHVGGGAKIYPSDGCGTILKIDDFAHVTLITGASEIGQGSETVLAQLVCEELGLPLSAVTVVNNDTDITPWDVGVHASRTTFIAGNSAIGAAKKAKEKILAAAAPRFGQRGVVLLFALLEAGVLDEQHLAVSLIEAGDLAVIQTRSMQVFQRVHVGTHAFPVERASRELHPAARRPGR